MLKPSLAITIDINAASLNLLTSLVLYCKGYAYSFLCSFAFEYKTRNVLFDKLFYYYWFLLKYGIDHLTSMIINR